MTAQITVEDRSDINVMLEFTHNTDFTDIEWPTETAVGEESRPAPFALEQNRPNPFNPATSIRFTVSEAVHAELSVFNASGQRVETLIEGRVRPGSHETVWNAAGHAAGIYYYRLKTASFASSRKMLLVK